LATGPPGITRFFSFLVVRPAHEHLRGRKAHYFKILSKVSELPAGFDVALLANLLSVASEETRPRAAA